VASQERHPQLEETHRDSSDVDHSSLKNLVIKMSQEVKHEKLFLKHPHFKIIKALYVFTEEYR